MSKWGEKRAKSMIPTVFFQEVEQVWGEPVSNLVESVLQLITINGAGSITVKVEEDALPILEQFSSDAFESVAMARNAHLDVFPQTRELGVKRRGVSIRPKGKDDEEMARWRG